MFHPDKDTISNSDIGNDIPIKLTIKPSSGAIQEEVGTNNLNF